jgi:hypothetical protein
MNGQEFTFTSSEWRLLRSVLNEVLNGFKVNAFEATIGEGKVDLQKLLDYLSELPEDAIVRLDRGKTIAFRNALRESLRELGAEEFHTRTDYRFEYGERVLRELSALVRSK